jgi:hypothetical protein
MTYMAREREREREREERVERGLVRGVVRAACTDNEMTHVQLGMNESVWRGVRVGFFVITVSDTGESSTTGGCSSENKARWIIISFLY